MISFWWLLLSFVIGGYAGAVLVGLMAFSSSRDRPQHGRMGRNSRTDLARRRHGAMSAHALHSSYR